MNIENMTKLRDFMATLPEEAIAMEEWLRLDREGETAAEALAHTCGTVGCIAGWAYLLSLPPKAKLDAECYSGDITYLAGEWLGLSWDDAYRLFQGEWRTIGSLRDISKTNVLRELDRQIERAKELQHD